MYAALTRKPCTFVFCTFSVFKTYWVLALYVPQFGAPVENLGKIENGKNAEQNVHRACLFLASRLTCNQEGIIWVETESESLDKA